MSKPTRRFEPRTGGGWLHKPLPGAAADDLALCLSERVRKLAGTPVFLRGVEHIAAIVAHSRDDAPRMTVAERRNALLAVRQAAHDLRVALSALADRGDAFDDLDVQAEWVLLLARKGAIRPGVPALPPDVTSAGELLSRIDADLDSLRALCSYSAGQLKPNRNPQRGAERWLVQLLAESHMASYGKPPGPGSWFVAFAQVVGERIDLNIGRRVIADVLAGKPAPRRRK